jgi:1-acyl-sn-glycerol-3-phosphate acyltransferase
VLRVLWRFPLFIAHSLGFLGIGLAAALLLPETRWQRALARLQTAWARSLLRLLGVKSFATGASGGLRALRVSNHISYLDIPVLLAHSPGGFVAKAEVARWPLFGLMARLSGAIFLARDSGGSLCTAATRLQTRLRAAQPVYLFPEGTTTGGDAPVAFKSALLKPAALSGAGISLCRIDYGPANPEAAFTGDDALLPHLLRLMRRPFTSARLTVIAHLHGPYPDHKILTRDLELLLNLSAAAAAREAGAETPGESAMKAVSAQRSAFRSQIPALADS